MDIWRFSFPARTLGNVFKTARCEQKGALKHDQCLLPVRVYQSIRTLLQQKEKEKNKCLYLRTKVRRSVVVGHLPILTQHAFHVPNECRQENMGIGWWSKPVRP